MCVALPGKVLEVEGREASVECLGALRRVRLELLDGPVAPGDWLLCHAGRALRRMEAEEAAETRALLELLLEGEGPPAVPGRA